MVGWLVGLCWIPKQLNNQLERSGLHICSEEQSFTFNFVLIIYLFLFSLLLKLGVMKCRPQRLELTACRSFQSQIQHSLIMSVELELRSEARMKVG